MTPDLQEKMGCCLHIVLDDENLRDSDVEFCINHACEKGHVECLRLATMMLDLSKTQRKKVVHYYFYG